MGVSYFTICCHTPLDIRIDLQRNQSFSFPFRVFSLISHKIQCNTLMTSQVKNNSWKRRQDKRTPKFCHMFRTHIALSFKMSPHMKIASYEKFTMDWIVHLFHIFSILNFPQVSIHSIWSQHTTLKWCQFIQADLQGHFYMPVLHSRRAHTYGARVLYFFKKTQTAVSQNLLLNVSHFSITIVVTRVILLLDTLLLILFSRVHVWKVIFWHHANVAA